MTLIAVEDLPVLELKVVRKVRTPAGKKRYGQEIGSIIVRDGEPPLSHLSVLPKGEGFDGWDRVQGDNGKQYDVGYDADHDVWVATNAGDWNDIAVDDAESEEEVYRMLDDAVSGKRRKGDTRLGNRSMYDTEKDRQKGRKKRISERDQAKAKYGDKRKATYDKYVHAAIINFDKAVKEGNWDDANLYHEKMWEAIKGRSRQDNLRADESARLKEERDRKAFQEKMAETSRRAGDVQKNLEESAHFKKMKQEMEAADAQQRAKLDGRAKSLSKYTEPGADYDRNIADKISKYHEEMAKLADADTRKQRQEVIDRAKLQLQYAEQRATAKRNTGVVQHSLTTSTKVPAKPKHGEVGSTVRIGTSKVTITRAPRRDAHGNTSMGLDYLGRSYDVSVPTYKNDKSSKIEVYDKTSGESEEGFLPPRDEVPGTPAERAEYANTRLSQIMNRLHTRMRVPAKEQRKMTLQTGSKGISQMPEGKVMTDADEQKMSTLRRHLDAAIAQNNEPRMQAILDIMDEAYAEYGIGKREGPRVDIAKLRDAGEHTMKNKPLLNLDGPNTFDDFKEMEDWQLSRFMEAGKTELARLGATKVERRRAAIINANIERAQKVLAERQ